jgi:hypothetical protein
MYCNNCGSKIDSEDFFCSVCGKKTKNKPGSENSELETKNFRSETSTSRDLSYAKTITSSFDFRSLSVQNSILKGIWIVALLCIIGTLSSAYSTFTFDYDKSPDANILKSQDNVQVDKNIKLCEQIAADYCNSHTYSKDGVYDCDNMAQDIWNMLKAKGINARIAVGNFNSFGSSKIAKLNIVPKISGSGSLGEIEVPNRINGTMNLSNSSTIDSFNHAWVLAEVSPGLWLAIECTGGYIVYSDENEKYYQGVTFSNPKNYRSFLSLYRDWKAKALDYENERSYYKELICSYNNASESDQIAMKSGIEVAQRTLQEKEKAFTETDSELNALLKYG